MKQSVTRALFEYWDALRGSRAAPSRSEVDPGAIPSCLPHTFVLTFSPTLGHPFRIAGTAICTMFGSELACTPFQRLWTSEQRSAICGLVDALAQSLEGAAGGVTGRNAETETVELDMILLPLTDANGGAVQVLGALSAAAAPYWLDTRPLQTLSLRTIRAAGTGSCVPAGNMRRAVAGLFDPPATARTARSLQG